ncbi:hypothetical protein V6N11_049847 [Hibiscus sabdariffa]|uniref:Reverse transcriptase n=1 Tax=Hibiscus sabdariffa TaxID=183260 RepID=A0ABR2T850_9ROSI
MLVENWKSDLPIVESIASFQVAANRWNQDSFGHMGRQKHTLLARIYGIKCANESSDVLTLVMEMREFTREITDEEVRVALFSMNPLKLPGLDGLHAMFFQCNWSIVGATVVSFVQASMGGHQLDPGLNRTLIVLIPKVLTPEVHIGPI